MTVDVDDPGFESLARAIARDVGMSVDVYKDRCLKRRLAVRMRACGVRTFADYEAVLKSTPGEPARLREALTINVTKFFRNLETWVVLRSLVIPDLVVPRTPEAPAPPIRAWSAGCASGEEPYSLAMLFADVADRGLGDEWLARCIIHATDIDEPSLARARAGRYKTEALAEAPADLVQRYTKSDDKEVAVVDRLRRLVEITELNLSSATPPQYSLDLILCRNVIIYFGRPMQERLFSGFAHALSPGGVLVLGKVETLLGPARDHFDVIDARERVYRRRA